MCHGCQPQMTVACGLVGDDAGVLGEFQVWRTAFVSPGPKHARGVQQNFERGDAFDGCAVGEPRVRCWLHPVCGPPVLGKPLGLGTDLIPYPSHFKIESGASSLATLARPLTFPRQR